MIKGVVNKFIQIILSITDVMNGTRIKNDLKIQTVHFFDKILHLSFMSTITPYYHKCAHFFVHGFSNTLHLCML